MKKNNVHFLKQKRPKKRRKFQTSDANKASVRAYYHLPDETPDRWEISAALVFSDYVFWCNSENIKPCSETIFRRLSTQYVDKVQRAKGRIYYSPNNSLLNVLMLTSDVNEVYDIAC